MASNFFNKASLVMVPDAPIDGKLPSVKPEDRSGDFTFSRGSNLAATRVNKDGLIEKGRENLLLQSNQFDTTWGTLDSEATIGQIGYDGSNNAWLVSKTDLNGRVQQNIVTSGVQTFSVYVKAGTKNWVALRVDGSGVNTYFDLQNGVVGFTSNTIEANIKSLGNDWYRCSVTLSSGITRVRIYVADGDNDTSGTSGSIYIQDAQLELGLVATDYIETTTATVQKGILENLPRLDYSGGASCPSLLLEPQRSQLITQSEYFGSATWNKQNSIGVNTNSHLSPEGIQNATELDGFDSSNFQSVAQYITLSAGTYTFSVFLKKTTGALNHYPAVVMGSVYKYVIVNSTTGTYAESTGTNNNDSVTIESWDDNWWRVSLTNTLSAGAQRFAIYPALSANGTFITTNASGTNVFWGAQVEVGSYPTSYIPAYGSSVTRSQEYGRTTHSAYEVNEEQGVIFAEFEYLGGKDFQVVSMHNGGALVNWLMIDTAGNLRGSVFYDNAFQVTMNSSPTTLSPNTNYKAAFRYESGNNVLYLNGVKVGTNTSTFTNPPTLPYIQVGGFWQLSNTNVNCKLKQALLFNTSLTDDECIALTTI